MILEQPCDRVGVAGRLERHLIARGEAVREQPQRLWRHRDLACLADLSVLPDRDLRELTVDIESDAPSHHASSQSSWTRESRRAQRHLRIRARSASGQVAGAAK